MVKDGGWPDVLAEWATHIREMGNAGAHPEVFGEIDLDEANDLNQLVRQLLDVVYVLPAKIAKARADRPPRLDGRS